jgi:hypothetical protein
MNGISPIETSIQMLPSAVVATIRTSQMGKVSKFWKVNMCRNAKEIL